MTDSAESLKNATLQREGREPISEPGGHDARALAQRIAELADDMKADDIVLMEVGSTVGYADWFVVCNGNTDRQVKAIHDRVVQGIKDEMRIPAKRIEGLPEARWVLVDFVDVVLHVFTPEAREFYRLDRLYGDVPSRPFEPTAS